MKFTNNTRKNMSTHYNKNRSNGMRNIRSAGLYGANFAAKAAGKSAAGIFRWATTDHSGMTQAMINMPKMGFIDSIKYILLCFCGSVIYAITVGVLMFLSKRGLTFTR